jgi:hypothetical protein
MRTLIRRRFAQASKQNMPQKATKLLTKVKIVICANHTKDRL